MDGINQTSQTQQTVNSTPAPTNTNNSSKSKVITIILGIAAAIVIAIGAYVLGTKQSQPVVQNIVQTTPIPSPTPVDETAGWKLKSTEFFSFKYPLDWYLTDETPNYVRVQNYNPAEAEGRGYDSSKDKGKYSIQVAMSKKNIKTIADLITSLQVDDKREEEALGDKHFIRNEKEIQVNGKNAFYREVALVQPTNRYTPIIYIIDGKEKVVQIYLSLDVENGKSYFDQILFTFRFSN